MRVKNGILFLVLVMGCSVFAEDAILRKNYSDTQKSAIQYSNYKAPNAIINNFDAELIPQAVKDLQMQIKRNPDNYYLYANLADLDIKGKYYNEAVENLQTIYKAKEKGLLAGDLKILLNKMSAEYKRVPKKDGELYLSLAMLSMITDDGYAVDYAILGADRSNNTELSKKVMEIVFESNQDTEKAINACDKILVRNSNDVEIRKIKAAYLVKSNQKKEAIDEYSKIISLSPNDDESRYILYKLLGSSKKNDDKDKLKQLYYMLSPYSEEQAYVKLTELLMKNNDFSDAKHYAEVLMKKYSDNPNGYILMSELYKREGKIKESYEVLNKAREKADNNDDIAKYNVMLAKLSDEPVREANNLLATGLYEQALEVLDSANPENLYVILTQARANYLLGKKQKTFDLLNKAMSLYTDNSDVYCAFGYIYLQEGDIDTARNYVNQSLKLDKNNQTAKDLLGLVNKAESSKYTTDIINALEAQNYQEGMRLVNEAIAIDANSADLYYYKSLFFIALNNYAASTATLYKCIELDKNYTDAYFYLGFAFDNLGEKSNALNNYQKYLNMSVGDEIVSTERIDYAKTRIRKLNG